MQKYSKNVHWFVVKLPSVHTEANAITLGSQADNRLLLCPKVIPNSVGFRISPNACLICYLSCSLSRVTMPD